MSKNVIEVSHLSKYYRLGEVGTGTISHDLNRFWHKIRGKEDPYMKLSELNDRSNLDKSDYVWALEDVSFQLEPGDVLGVIGKNGAGKSTLLKILSRITAPSKGSVKLKGRMSSLLEVGTGFHLELTGRENIYLNGAILGMTKREITAKLDEIVDFSGCGKYLDTPVKRYSSGMIVRLGFAVAANLEAEILIVDEVLAVGDQEFQNKCIGKMQDISKTGKTVLFVSHNLTSVKSLCSKGLLIENGRSTYFGDVNSAISNYLQAGVREASFDVDLSDFRNRKGSGLMRFIYPGKNFLPVIS
jgi:lipopolysaccharide transport system ATP-binding protein